MIKINKIPEQVVELFTPNDESLGFVNDLELNDIKIQICKNDLEGYYIRYNNEKILINKDGELLKWPKGLFDKQLTQFAELINCRKNKLYDKTRNS